MEMECISGTSGKTKTWVLRKREVFWSRHTFVSWSKGSLASPGACVLWGWLWPPQCFLQLLDLKLKLVCSGINKATSRASRTEQAPKRKGGPGMMEFWGRNNSERFLHKHSHIPSLVTAQQLFAQSFLVFCFLSQWLYWSNSYKILSFSGGKVFLFLFWSLTHNNWQRALGKWLSG